MGQKQDNVNQRLCRLSSCLSSIRKSRVHEGLGAVGVFIGVGLLCLGIVFTVVNHEEKSSQGISSFRFTGPVLFTVSFVFIIGGYILSNTSNLWKIWTYVRRRKQFPYIDYDHYFKNDVKNNILSVICFKVMKIFFRIRERRQLSEFESSGESRSSVMTSELPNSNEVRETDINAQMCRRRDFVDVKMTYRRSNSMPLISQSLRNFKVSPISSGSLSNCSCDIQQNGTFKQECVV